MRLSEEFKRTEEVRQTNENAVGIRPSSSSFEDAHRERQKRNPHSIEELLKSSPVVRTSCSSLATLHSVLFQPPCGLLIDQPCTCTFLASPTASTSINFNP